MLWWILTALCLLLSWAGSLLLLPGMLWVPMVPTAVVVLVFVVRRLRARKAAREIESVLSAQAEAQQKNARPDLQPEIQAMRAEFSKAIAALKSSKLSRGGTGDALGVLPWYLVIGPPGAGKSTALRNSGLKFPYLSQRGGVRGVGGTRNCEWWLTNEAVILDTAGRYTTGDEDREEWLAFLDTLARARPRRPINGLILAVSVSELLEGEGQGAAELGQRLRERVDELTSHLGQVVPVYVLLTKCDLLAGFVEMFGDLPRTERGQIWGVTVPLHAARAEPRELVLERFDELVSVLEERALHRLGTERGLEAREHLYRFPRQFESLRGLLEELLLPLVSENPYHDTPPLRGLYFTSGTQQGRPMDRVMKSMAEAFGVNRAVPRSPPAVEARSYFLHDLFSKVVFRDQQLAVRSSEVQHRRRLLHLASAGGGLLLALGLVLLPLLSFFGNRALLSTAERAERAWAVDRQGREGASALSDLVPLRDLLQELEAHEAHGPPLRMRFGLYQGESLLPAVRVRYANAVRKLLAEPLVAADAGQLNALLPVLAGGSGQAPTSEQFVRAFRLLEHHLQLTNNRQPGEPVPDAGAQAVLVERLVEFARSGGPLAGADPELLASHARLYVSLVARHPVLGSRRRTRLVELARTALRRLNMLPQVQLQHLVDRLGHEGDVTLQGLLGPASASFTSSRRVPAAFTRSVWEKELRSWLREPLQDSQTWVLGGGSSQQEKAGQEALRAAYYQRYREEWLGFLASIEPVLPGKDEQALALLRVLTTGEPKPLERLLLAVEDNVRLESPATSASKVILPESLGNLMQERIRERDPDEKYLEALRGDFEGLLRFGLAPGKEGKGTVPSALLGDYEQRLVQLKQALAESQGTSGQQARELVADAQLWIVEQEPRWRPWLTRMLVTPLESVVSAHDKDSARELNKVWCGEVVSPLQRTLLRYYPFRKNGPDAPLADFSQVYRPGGLLEAFYNAHLGGEIKPVGGGRFEVSPTRRGGTSYARSLLSFLARSKEIRSSFFEGSDLKTRFHVQMLTVPGVESVAFSVDGSEVEYRMGPAQLGQKDMQWPGTASGRGGLGASLVVRTRSGSDTLRESGEWGLFRLLARARSVTVQSPRQFTVTWHSERLGVDIPVEFTTERTENPFFGARGASPGASLFPLFRGGAALPPMNIGLGAGGCQ